MSEVLDRLVYATVQGTLALAVVAAVTLIFRNLTPNVRAWLWRLAFLRFLIALVFEWSAPILPPNPTPANAPPLATASVPTAAPILEVVIVPPAPAAPAAPDPSVLWLTLWAVPAIGLFLVGMGRYLRLRWIAHQATPVAAEIRATDRVPVPCLVGLWRGLILLPTVLLHPSRAEECAMAVAHETAHRDRRDPLFGLVNFLVACAFWFVVPVWFALREYAVQVEMDCDQRALRSTRLSARRYGGMLVAFATQTPFPVGAQSMGGGRSGLKRRILAMKKPLTPPTIASLALAATLGAFLLIPVRPVEASVPAVAPPPAAPANPNKQLANELRAAQTQIDAARATLRASAARSAKSRAERRKLEAQLQAAQKRIDAARVVLRRNNATPRPVRAPQARAVVGRPLSEQDRKFLAEAEAIAKAANPPILRDLPLILDRQEVRIPDTVGEKAAIALEGSVVDPDFAPAFDAAMKELRRQGVPIEPKQMEALAQRLRLLHSKDVQVLVRPGAKIALPPLATHPGQGMDGMQPLPPASHGGRGVLRIERGMDGMQPLPPASHGGRGVLRIERGMDGSHRIGRLPLAELKRSEMLPPNAAVLRATPPPSLRVTGNRIVVVFNGKRHVIDIPIGKDQITKDGLSVRRKIDRNGKTTFEIKISQP